MKTSDKEIHLLTQKLLKESLVEPSPDVSLRIMDLIMQEEPLKVTEVKRVKVSSGISPLGAIGFLLVYLLAFAGGWMLLSQYTAGDMSPLLHSLKEKLPYFLTLAVIAGSLIFYSTLDKIFALRF